MSKLLIIGAGGHGMVVKEIMSNKYKKIDFLDDNSVLAIDKIENCVVYKNYYNDLFIAIGNSNKRHELIEKLKDDFNIINVIHANSSVENSVKLGIGCFIGNGAIINSNVEIEDGVIIGIGALIDHNVTLRNYSYVNAGAIICANTTVLEYSIIEQGKVFRE